MTHNEMIAMLTVGTTLVSGEQVNKITHIKELHSDANMDDHYASTITIDNGQTVGSEQLHDLVYVRRVIAIQTAD